VNNDARLDEVASVDELVSGDAIDNDGSVGSWVVTVENVGEFETEAENSGWVIPSKIGGIVSMGPVQNWKS